MGPWKQGHSGKEADTGSLRSVGADDYVTTSIKDYFLVAVLTLRCCLLVLTEIIWHYILLGTYDCGVVALRHPVGCSFKQRTQVLQ
jgi:hypothetical protein